MILYVLPFLSHLLKYPRVPRSFMSKSLNRIMIITVIIVTLTLSLSIVSLSGDSKTNDIKSFPTKSVSISPNNKITDIAYAQQSSPVKYVNGNVTFDIVRLHTIDKLTLSSFQTTDNQTIAKYPILQTPMKKADERYNLFLTMCSSGTCSSEIGWTTTLNGSPPKYQISADSANAMIGDPDLNFHEEYHLYITDLKVGNGVYSIVIYP